MGLKNVGRINILFVVRRLLVVVRFGLVNYGVQWDDIVVFGIVVNLFFFFSFLFFFFLLCYRSVVNSIKRR